MLETFKPENILFLDIETVPSAPEYSALSPRMQMLWEKKSATFRNPGQNAEEVYQRAGIYAEFGKIICISVGIITEREPFSFRLKSYFGDDEKTILNDFSAALGKFASGRDITLCAHNGMEFDYPYIARRMIVNGVALPSILDNAGKKPWEVKLLDTMELWKFGDHKNYTSLDTLSAILGIESPKDDIDGSMVAGIYWNDHDLQRIVKYCEKDVLCVARILLRFMNYSSGVGPEKIESVTVI